MILVQHCSKAQLLIDATFSFETIAEGFCDSEDIIEDNRGLFQWEETITNSNVTLPCAFGPSDATAFRICFERLNWTPPNVEACATIVTIGFQVLNSSLNEVSWYTSQLQKKWIILILNANIDLS